MRYTNTPPGPRPVPVLGHAIPFVRDRLAFLEHAASFGPLAKLRLLGRPFYLVTSPELLGDLFARHAGDLRKDDFFDQLRRLLGDGLATSEDPLWRLQRKRMAHAFTPSRIRTYADKIGQAALGACAQWADGDTLNVHRCMAELSMDVVGRTLFDIDLRRDAPKLERAWTSASDYYVDVLESPFSLPPWWPSIGNLRFIRAVREIDRTLNEIIACRRKSGLDRGDLVSAMLLATDERGQGMTERQVRDECMTMFIAGHETSGLAMVHALYLLSKHPEIERRVFDEVKNVLDGRVASAADVERLVFTSQVVREAMRLLPPVWGLLRKSVCDIELGGYRIPAGSTLMFSQWVTHRWPSAFHEPDRFDPDRWAADRVSRMPRFAYFPFGLGRRVCIANHFAMMELVVVLATLLRHFRFDSDPDATLEFRPSVTLCPKEDLIMSVRSRLPRACRLRDPAVAGMA